jgi:hypothetical protein
MASTARPRPKAAITCSKNSQPIVGMVPVAGQVQVEMDRPGGDQQTGTRHVQHGS